MAVLPSAPPATPTPATPPPTASPGHTKHPPAQTPTPEPSTAATDTPPPTTSSEPTIPVDPNDPACSDPAYSLEGFAWKKPFQWYFNRDSVPAQFDADAVLAVIQRGFDNITMERNDCGRPDTIGASAIYLGEAHLQPCTDRGDDTNVVAFGPPAPDLSVDTIAYTCPYTFSSTGDVAEADIVISNEEDWALSVDDCFDTELLEPTITHEVGHAFGLGHVSERHHADLTMSPQSNGPCDNEESTLGLGDMLGLEQLYGPAAGGSG